MLTRKEAIHAICSLDEAAFGHDKGSGEAYEEWAIREGLAEYDESADDIVLKRQPPFFDELLLSIGVTPDEIIEVTHINPACFPPEMCDDYGVPYPSASAAHDKPKEVVNPDATDERDQT